MGYTAYTIGDPPFSMGLGQAFASGSDAVARSLTSIPLRLASKEEKTRCQ
jgi:hypothetical protein